MEGDRVYPLARPKGHKPPMKRWKLEYEDDALEIQTAYIGVQRHDSTPTTTSGFQNAVQTIQQQIDSANHLGSRAPIETFQFLEGDDATDSIIWVCYWANPTASEQFLQQLKLVQIYNQIGRPPTVGIWCERFTTAISRLETNYSGLDYLPGLARLPGGKPKEHTLTAYWGAARDRIPSSGHDLFKRASCDETQPPHTIPKGVGQRVFGANQYDNLVHIRSGQFWANCDAAETEAYEKLLQPALMAGLEYVWKNREESGAIGLRFLRNRVNYQNKKADKETTSNKDTEGGGESEEGQAGEAKETCAAGFFRSLEDLERWAKRHPSHLAIFNGAIKHARTFGDSRKFRTWHEVSLLKKGEARFEYVNCLQQTGVIPYLALDHEAV